MSIKLSLPQVADTPDPAVETRPVYIEEWVETLAYATPVHLLEQTLNNVKALYRQPMKSAQRLKEFHELCVV